MTEHLSQSEMLEKLHHEHRLFQAALSRFTPAQMQMPNTLDQWSIKDMVAHCSYWNRFPIGKVAGAINGIRPEHVWRKIDEINAQVVEASRSQALEEVLQDFEQSYHEIEEVLTHLPPIAFEENGVIEKTLGYSVTHLYKENTFGHYAIHRAELETFDLNLL